MLFSRIRAFVGVLAVSAYLVVGAAPIPAQTPQQPVRSTPKPRIAAKLVTLPRGETTYKNVADAITRQTGLPIHLPAALAAEKLIIGFDQTPYWQALEELAERSRHRIADSKLGQVIELVPRRENAMPAPSCITGPFRTSVKQVIGKRDLDTGLTGYELHLQVQWEPRFPVYFMDSEPALVAVAGAQPGSQARVRVATTGYTHPIIVRLTDVPRGATQIDQVEFRLGLLAAEKLLAFKLDDLTTEKPTVLQAEGVKLTFKPLNRAAARATARLDLEYPADHPVLESFQQFATSNRLRLLNPDGRTLLDPSDYSTLEVGRSIQATYVFDLPADKKLTGWKAVYETPSPLLELQLPIVLKGIPLP